MRATQPQGGARRVCTAADRTLRRTAEQHTRTCQLRAADGDAFACSQKGARDGACVGQRCGADNRAGEVQHWLGLGLGLALFSNIGPPLAGQAALNTSIYR